MRSKGEIMMTDSQKDTYETFEPSSIYESLLELEKTYANNFLISGDETAMQKSRRLDMENDIIFLSSLYERKTSSFSEDEKKIFELKIKNLNLKSDNDRIKQQFLDEAVNCGIWIGISASSWFWFFLFKSFKNIEKDAGFIRYLPLILLGATALFGFIKFLTYDKKRENQNHDEFRKRRKRKDGFILGFIIGTSVISSIFGATSER